jgi:hypothetical protein
VPRLRALLTPFYPQETRTGFFVSFFVMVVYNWKSITVVPDGKVCLVNPELACAALAAPSPTYTHMYTCTRTYTHTHTRTHTCALMRTRALAFSFSASLFVLACSPRSSPRCVSQEMIDIVLSRTQRKTPTIVHPQFHIARIRSFYQRKSTCPSMHLGRKQPALSSFFAAQSPELTCVVLC